MKRMSAAAFVAAAVVVIAVLAAACGDPQDKLPPMMRTSGTSTCAGEPALPPDGVEDVCFWMRQVGSLVVGTIEAVESSTEPLDPDTCDGIDRALVVRLRVDELLWGEETPATIDVHFGVAQYGFWTAVPLIDDDGSITWVRVEDDTAPLFVGQELGLRVSQPDDRDHFVSDRAFAFLPTGEVQLSTAFCEAAFDPYPSRAAFLDAVATCDDPDGGSLVGDLGDASCFDAE